MFDVDTTDIDMNHTIANCKKLVRLGYNITPILPITAKKRDKKTGELVPHKSAGKAPALAGWQANVATMENVDEWWGSERDSRRGVGILTHHNPAVDLDILDEKLAKRMKNWVELNLETDIETPIRVGSAPKMLMLFRTDAPFRKVKSHTWLDDEGRPNAVEVLGSGQQFVAFGIHPKTKKPYKWTNPDATPQNCHASMDLPLLTLEMAREICDAFDRMAEAAGLTFDDEAKSRQRGSLVGEDPFSDADTLDDDEQDLVDAIKPTWEGEYDELAELLDKLEPENDYSRWVAVIAAIKDGEREPDEFKELAREWSARADNFDDDGFEEKWEKGSFGRIALRRDTPVADINDIKKWIRSQKDEKTARAIVRRAKMQGDIKLLRQWQSKLANLKIAPSSMEAAAKVLKDRIATLYQEQHSPEEVLDVMDPLAVVNADDWPSLRTSQKKPVPTSAIENTKFMMAQYGLTAYFDVVQRRSFVTGWPAGHPCCEQDNDNTILTEVMSLASRNELPVGAVMDHVESLARSNPRNLQMEFVDSKPWDGKTRLPALYKTLVSPMDDEEESKALKETLVRRWLISAAKILQYGGSADVQARGVLVLSGGQYIGKSRWLLSLVPDQPGYCITGVNLNVTNKDDVIKTNSNWLVELGELDATFRKSDIAQLKAYISAPNYSVRLPYARKPVVLERRTCYFATVNDDIYLRDDTGNTRWWTIPIKKVVHNHKIDIQQLWAEVFHLMREGEQHFLTMEEMELLNEHNKDFEVEPSTELKVQALFNWQAERKDWTVWMNASEVCEMINTRADPATLRIVGSYLKRRCGPQKATGPERVKKYLVPPLHEGTWDDDL